MDSPEDYDLDRDLISPELSNMKCKLESKSKALVILSQDLVEVKRERDEYKLMAEQIRDRYHGLKKRIKDFQPNINGGLSVHHSLVDQFAANTPLSHIMLELTEQNKYLVLEVEELKTKLVDAEGDLKMMREQLKSQYRSDLSFRPSSSHHRCVSFADGIVDPTSPSHPRNSRTMEEVVAQLETFRSRVSLMERDLQIILDEKEELIVSRDSFKRKSDRLNRRLNDILRTSCGLKETSGKSHENEGVRGMTSSEGELPSPAPVDIDSLERDNAYLRDKLGQMEDEKKLSDLMLSKYKAMLEKSQSNKRNLLSSIGITSPSKNTGLVNGFDASSSSNISIPSNVISSRQIQQFIASNGLNHLEVSSASVSRLRSLILALFEALCDKSSALALHRKNNKLLGRRITELEDKLRQLTTEKVLMLTKTDHVFRALEPIESVDEPDSDEQVVTEEEPVLEEDTDSDAGQEIAIPSELQTDDSPE